MLFYCPFHSSRNPHSPHCIIPRSCCIHIQLFFPLVPHLHVTTFAVLFLLTTSSCILFVHAFVCFHFLPLNCTRHRLAAMTSFKPLSGSFDCVSYTGSIYLLAFSHLPLGFLLSSPSSFIFFLTFEPSISTSFDYQFQESRHLNLKHTTMAAPPPPATGPAMSTAVPATTTTTTNKRAKRAKGESSTATMCEYAMAMCVL